MDQDAPVVDPGASAHRGATRTTSVVIGLVLAIHGSSLKLAGKKARIPRQAGGMTVDR
jgi:hypothetical protein